MIHPRTFSPVHLLRVRRHPGNLSDFAGAITLLPQSHHVPPAALVSHALHGGVFAHPATTQGGSIRISVNECAVEKSAPHKIGYAVETYDTTTTRMEIKLGGELEHITHLGLTPCLQQKTIAARHSGTCVRVHTV